MVHLVLGPVLMIGGLALVYFAIQGLPPSLRRLSPISRARERAIIPDDFLIGEVLSEMLHLREELSSLQSQVSLLKSGPRRPSRAAG